MIGYSRGSEWRRWDLHVHSPASALNNQFEGSTPEEKWAKYLQTLRGLTGISALGITDYFSIEGYLRTKRDGALTNIDFLIPNVELRILPVTGSKSPINLHVLFDPGIVEELDSKFFSSLEFRYDNQTYKCTRSDLIRLGKKYQNDQTLLDDVAYRHGIEQFKTSVDRVWEILNRDKRLKEKSIVALSNSSRDGASGVQHSSLAATREEIYRISQMIFSGNPNDREYFLGKGIDSNSEVIRKYGGLKPCVHGSDAHKNSEVCRPCAKRGLAGHDCIAKAEECEFRFTWIKADPTFEGLRQILFEPEYRVHIGPKPPYEPLYKIGTVSFAFPETTKLEDDDFCLSGKSEISFSPNLTCLIGGRGTGKSTILNLIAEKLRPGSAVFFQKNKLKITDGKSINDCVRIDEDCEEKYVEFLSQNEIEEFALDNRKFTEAIYQRLIKLDSEKGIARRQTELEEEFRKIEQHISDIMTQRRLEENRASKAKELETNKKLLASIESPEYKEITEAVMKADSSLRKIKTAQNKFNELLMALDRLFKANKLFAEPSNAFEIEHNRILEQIGQMLERSRAVDFGSSIEDEKKIAAQLKEGQDRLQGYLSKQGLTAEDLNDISGASEKINNLTHDIEKLSEEITNIESRVAEYVINELSGAQKDYENEMRKQISPISEKLKSVDNEVKPITLEYEFSEYNANVALLDDFERSFSREGMPKRDILANYLLDKQRPLEVTTKEQFLEAIIGGKKTLIQTQKFLIDVLSDDFNFGIFKLLIRKNYANAIKFKVLKVLYDGKPLKNTSFGQRCTAAIIVLLSLGNNPIIIDEPEAHLDSALIANYLVNIVKDKKQSRQIVFATHNANFVINGDSELIHCLEIIEKKTKVVSMTIENLSHREKLLRLEGGQEAFKLRGEKYQAGFR